MSNLLSKGGHLVSKGGHLVNDTCCYQQYRKCSDNTLADVWIKKSIAPAAVKIAGQCYYKGSDPTSCAPGTIYSSWTSISGCSDSGCGGSDTSCCGTVCDQCSGAAPSQFHVTFTGVSLCTCADCSGSSVQLSGSPNGTFVVTSAGLCGWSVNSGITGTLYEGDGCTGPSAPIELAVDITRISPTQYQLQIIDSTQTVVVFDATVTVPVCCSDFTATNSLTACGCGGGGTFIAAGTGGSATVTTC